jgi:AcrR family transcriptional regulator
VSSPTRSDAKANLEKLLTSAAEVFARDGLSATLADVARHAGVGVGTVYRRFANKDDLIYELYAPRFKDAERQAREASEVEDPWEGFVRFFEQTARELADDKGHRELVMGGSTDSMGWARGTPPDRLVELFGQSREVIGGHLITLVRRAKEAGKLRGDFEASDMMVLSLGVLAAIDFGRPQHPELYRRTIGLILDGLCVARDSPSQLPVPALTGVELVSLAQRRP